MWWDLRGLWWEMSLPLIVACNACLRTREHQMKDRILILSRRCFVCIHAGASRGRPGCEVADETEWGSPPGIARITERSFDRITRLCALTMNDVSIICAQFGWNAEEARWGGESKRALTGGLLARQTAWETRCGKGLTLNTDASKRSLPDVRASLGLSRLRLWNKPVGDRKSGIPACTEMPAPGIQCKSKGRYSEQCRALSAERDAPQTTTKRLALRIALRALRRWCGTSSGCTRNEGEAGGD